MEEVAGAAFGQGVFAANIKNLSDASLHGFGDLARIGQDQDAAGAASAQIVERDALEEQGVERIGQKDRDRVSGFLTEFSRADHERPSASSERSSVRSPGLVKPSSEARRS